MKIKREKRKVCFIIQDENSKTIISKLFWQHCAEGNTKGVHILIIYPLFDNPLTWTRNSIHNKTHLKIEFLTGILIQFKIIEC